ncbi:MAG: lipoate--protein ligase family protein [Armatimonadetes bacterium]|nr:lipoate--protein ligase family protein [Armatimonadota bacterium]
MIFRLILNDPLPGPLNMALDEALLLCHDFGLSSPTLRLYRWSPPCLSIGLLQSLGSVDWLSFLAHGCQIVRRPTGGGAVLHHKEITYSIVFDPMICPLGSSVLATYQWIALGLVEALKTFGIVSTLPAPKTGNRPTRPAHCYDEVAVSDLAVSGKKICGSAQARKKKALLQHGGLPIGWDTDLLSLFASPLLFQSLTCLEWLLLRPVAIAEVLEALIQGFQKGLEVELKEGTFTPLEWAIAQDLLRKRYENWDWTAKRTRRAGEGLLLGTLAERLKEGFPQ